MKRALCAVVSLVPVGIIVMLPALKPSHHAFDLERLGQLPVRHDGRVKPLDTVARSLLLSNLGKQTLRTPSKNYQALEWLLTVSVHPDQADKLPMMVVQNSQILGLIDRNPESKQQVSFSDFVPYLSKIESEAAMAEKVEAKSRSSYEREIVSLKSKLVAYTQLKNTFQPEGVRQFELYTQRFVQQVPRARDQLMAHQANPEADPKTVESLNEIGLYFKQLQYVSQASLFKPCPPTRHGSDWQTLGDGYLILLKEKSPNPSAIWLTQIMSAFESNHPQRFNSAVNDYQRWLSSTQSVSMTKVRVEYWLNRSELFYGVMIVYLVVTAMVFIGWLMPREWIFQLSRWMLNWGFLVHSFGILTRMWVEGRPPVTNLYTSAVFVGWVAVAVGLMLERVYRNGIGAIVSGMIGFSTLIVAHHLSLQGDTIQMMQAVLDSNFWLATHVVTVCIGYGATFLAGFLAIVYVVRGAFTRTLDVPTRESLVRMIYATLCFALLFSFVGTVLGGIWADQSWGRFWGWDPKENGAFIIVLWNAAILHARWGGMIRERGLVAMALFGNCVTAFSWFGVNMLGVGLHSYGFMESAFFGLVTFVFSQLALIWGLFVPRKYWRSH